VELTFIVIGEDVVDDSAKRTESGTVELNDLVMFVSHGHGNGCHEMHVVQHLFTSRTLKQKIVLWRMP
jgi:hypothetical protein